MRNYIKVDNATLTGNDGAQDQTLSFFGLRPGRALNFAQVVGNLLASSGWTGVNAIQNPDIYVLLNHDLITSYLIFPQQGSQPTGGLLGNSLLNTLRSISEAEGLDPYISPKFQNVRPWNGRKT